MRKNSFWENVNAAENFQVNSASFFFNVENLITNLVPMQKIQRKMDLKNKFILSNRTWNLIVLILLMVIELVKQQLLHMNMVLILRHWCQSFVNQTTIQSLESKNLRRRKGLNLDIADMWKTLWLGDTAMVALGSLGRQMCGVLI